MSEFDDSEEALLVIKDLLGQAYDVAADANLPDVARAVMTAYVRCIKEPVPGILLKVH
jgi:hypothetical protein